MGKSAPTIDNDTLALLLDAVCAPQPVHTVSTPQRAADVAKGRSKKPASRDAVITPLPTKKRAPRDGRDPMLSDYLSSLGRVPLLDAAQEIDMANALKRAEMDVWLAILSFPAGRAFLLTSPAMMPKWANGEVFDNLRVAALMREVDEDRAIVDAALAAIQAAVDASSTSEQQAALASARAARKKAIAVRNRFVRANLRLVVSVARRFHHYRLPLIDLIQEGNLGLLKSVHRYDPDKGFRFSTYAHWWIRQAIERAIMNKGAQVRLPVHMFDARRELHRAERDLALQLGRDATDAELAVALGISLERLREVQKAVPREPMSLDEQIGDDDRTLGEVIADTDAVMPDEAVTLSRQKLWVRRVLMRLTPMEVDILTRRFGLNNDEEETLEAIGDGYKLSRERVRQIQVASLKKMQRYADAPARSHS